MAGEIRRRPRTTAPPTQLKRRSRTAGPLTKGGYTPPAPRPTTGLRSRSRTEKPTPSTLRGRSRTEGAAPGPTNVQIAKALRGILRLLGQQPPQSASNGRTSSAKAEAARKRGVPKARVVSPKDMVRGKGVLR
jgi:hypothetical protein